MNEDSYRRLVRAGLAPLVDDVPAGPDWEDLQSPALTTPRPVSRVSGWVIAAGAAAVVLLVIGLSALFSIGETPATPTTAPLTTPSTSAPAPSVFVPPTRIVNGMTHLDLTLLDGTQLTVAYPADLDLISLGVQAEATGGVGAVNRTVITRYGSPEEFVALTEENQGPGQVTGRYTGPDGGRVERWDFPDIPYIVFDFRPWTAYVWDSKFEVSENTEGWVNNLHGTVDADGYLLLTADPPLQLVPAAEDPGPDGPDIRVDGADGSLLIFINDCDRMTRLDEESYGSEVFAFCDEATNTLFFVGGSAEVQERIHRTLVVSPPEPSDETTSTTSATGEPEAWRRLAFGRVFGGLGDQVITGLAVGPPGFVAVGAESETEANRTDAAVWLWSGVGDWQRVPTGSQLLDAEMTDVVWFPRQEMFVAVGHYVSDGAVWTSHTGLDWERVALLEFENPGGGIEVDAVTLGGPGLVAVGREWLSEGLSIPGAWMSADGRHWDRIGDLNRFSDNAAMVDVTLHGDTLFAVGYVEQTMPAVWAFLDNSFWELVAVGPQIGRDVVLTSIGSDGQRLTVTGSSSAEDVDARVWTSTDDGQTWVGRRQDAVSVGIPSLNDVVVTPAGWVAVGSDGATYRPKVGAAVWMSTDGMTWYRHPVETAAFAPEAAGVVMTSMAFGDGVGVAGGFAGQDCAERHARCELDAAIWTWTPKVESDR